MTPKKRTPISGQFFIGDKPIAGELTLDRGATKLYVHQPDFFIPNANDDRCILGALRDTTKVSLLQCNAPQIPGTYTSAEGRFNFAEIFPHFVLFGRSHLRDTEERIISIRFFPDDASTIFYCFDMFSTHWGEREVAAALIEKNNKEFDRTTNVGDLPIVAVYSGQREIVRAHTSIGKITAFNAPSANFGGPRGAYIKNRIGVEIEFQHPTKFTVALDAMLVCSRFLSLIAGRPQKLRKINIELASENGDPLLLDLYWSTPSKRRRSMGFDPHPGDLPIMAAKDPREFEKVLANWIARDVEWRPARMRFSEGWAAGNYYEIDRLVRAANMFDILPDAALPKPPATDGKVAQAREDARKLIKALPQSDQRDSALGAISRLGQPTLRDKIRFRARKLIETFPDKLERLDEVIAIAVDCRNHFVHGSAVA